MADPSNTTDPRTQWMRWIALVISSLTAAFWLLILLDILFCDLVVGCISVTRDMVLLFFLVIASIASAITAWRWERIGGSVLIFWGLAYSFNAFPTSHPYHAFSMLITGVPLLFSGIFLLQVVCHAGFLIITE